MHLTPRLYAHESHQLQRRPPFANLEPLNASGWCPLTSLNITVNARDLDDAVASYSNKLSIVRSNDSYVSTSPNAPDDIWTTLTQCMLE